MNALPRVRCGAVRGLPGYRHAGVETIQETGNLETWDGASGRDRTDSGGPQNLIVHAPRRVVGCVECFVDFFWFLKVGAEHRPTAVTVKKTLKSPVESDAPDATSRTGWFFIKRTLVGYPANGENQRGADAQQ